MTIQELKTKIEKAKKNSMLPEKLKAAIVAKLEKELAELEKSEKKEGPKAEEPKKEAKKHKAPREKREDETHEEYEKSCKELIAEDKERKAKSRKASKKSDDKTAIAKDLEAAEKLGHRAEKQYKHGELTRAQIEKLIKEFQAQIKHLTELLKKAPSAAKTEEGWKHKKKSKVAKKERGGYVGEDWIGQEVVFQGKKFKVEKRDKDGIYTLKGEKKGLLGGRDEMIATEKELQDRFELVEKMGKGGVIGGRGHFDLKKGDKITNVKQIEVGDIVLEHSNQFNADNTLKVVDKRTYGDSIQLDAVYWDAKTNKRIGNEDIGISQFTIDSFKDELWFPKKDERKGAVKNLHEMASEESTHEGKNKLTLPKGWGFKRK